MPRPVRIFTALGAVIKTFKNWPLILMDHLGLMRGQYICRLRNGIRFKMRANTDDRHVLFDIYAKNIYPLKIKPEYIVVDIGGHIGGFTLKAANNKACIYTYEPIEENLVLLRFNVDLNNAKNVNIFPYAIAAQAEKRIMYFPDNNKHSGRYSFYPDRGSKTVGVQSITLENIFGQNDIEKIDILKLDCQGAEYDIIYNTSVELFERVERIMVECEVFEDRFEWTPSGMRSYLLSLGYDVINRDNILYANKA